MSDRLPEETHYRDRGCPDLGIPLCVDCWLPRCRLDAPPKWASTLIQAMRVQALTDAGRTADQIAEQMGIARRTVFRLRKTAKRELVATVDGSE